MYEEHKKIWENFIEGKTEINGVKKAKIQVGKDSFICVIKLWDGVLLWANEINISKFYYPPNSFRNVNPLLINLCYSGRCEVKLTKGGYVYMSPGIIDFSDCPPQCDYYYPDGHYVGIELYFDMNLMKKNMPEGLSDYGINYEKLKEYLEKNETLVRVDDEAMKEAKHIYNLLHKEGVSVYDYRFAVLSLFQHLNKGGATEVESMTMITQGQRKIVAGAEEILTRDFRKRVTIEELARSFGISASALKKYFMIVYGVPISKYMKKKRIERAKELLADSRKNIGEIASECGYEHQGKFSVMFKEVTGVSPLEYRRLNAGIK